MSQVKEDPARTGKVPSKKTLEHQEDVQKALEQTRTKDEAEVQEITEPKHSKGRLGAMAATLACLIAFRFALAFPFFNFLGDYRPYVEKFCLGGVLIVIVMAISHLLQVYLIHNISDPVSRYNLNRIVRLITATVLAFIVVSMIFTNWYSAVVSLGLISLILGFALQAPITSFFGWIYLLIRQTYRVGDRIKIGDSVGDVIDLGYLDTTLWEVGGDLSTNHPSGRVIKFPNSDVFHSAVFNYSWPLFPYIWDEIKFQIGYESDLEFVSKIMRETAAEEIGEAMTKGIKTYRQLLSQTPVDELEVRENPAVLFRVSENTWVEAIVRYLVHPKESGKVKTRLIKKLLHRLNAEPERVLFPKGNAR